MRKANKLVFTTLTISPKTLEDHFTTYAKVNHIYVNYKVRICHLTSLSIRLGFRHPVGTIQSIVVVTVVQVETLLSCEAGTTEAAEVLLSDT